jgi:RimJ/RimL family protein N-acetyltransferase
VGLLSYRAATDEDAAMLAGWYADPEVSKYWDGRVYDEAEIVERLRREDVDAWIVVEDGEPVGYLQSWWEPDPPKRGGLDGFLIPSARGRGIMPAVARRLASTLLAEGWTEVTVDPYEWNGAALRAWCRAGFVEVSRHPADEEHISPWVLMRFDGVSDT